MLERVTILEVINKTTPYFEKQGVDSPRLTIELLLAHLLKKKRLQLYLEFERELDETTLTALRGMVKRRWGRIVAITSVVGATGNAGQANYAAAKAGMVGLSKALAAEVASRGITVNCVAPGFIATAMTGALTTEQRERAVSSIAIGRMGTSEEVAAGVLFLASDEARYITGHTLHINGGLAML